MAETDETEMPISSSKPETEWSTREKLAIASYVLRSGEQHWSGVGRILRPLGEPGRPTDWFSPKFCAQQYTALMEQLEAPKRKRSERSDSSENVQPSMPPEEIIIARLTKERIEELKKQVRCERTEYRKLKREIELLESGALDDQLDDLIDEIESGGKGESETNVEAVEPVSNNESKVEDQTSAWEAEGNLDVAQSTEPDKPTENTQKSMTEEAVPEEASVDESMKSEEFAEKMDTNATANKDEVKDDLNILKYDQEFVEDSFTPASVDKPEEKPKEVDSLTLAVVKESSSQLEIHKSDDDANQWLNGRMETDAEVTPSQQKEDGAIATSEGEGQSKEEKLEKPEPAPVQETETSSSLSIDEEAKQSISLPGTPAPAGSFLFDSFPSSPALSHNSDMDPDATANWKAWKKSIMILWKQIASHRLANIFLTPVTDEIAPNYSTTVYRKMDLIMIKKNIESGAIRTTCEFQRDIMLMFQNAIMYNNVEHDVYKMATEMQKDVIDQIAQYLATQMMVESSTQPPENKSLRRSTIRRSALSDKVGQTRSRRSAAAESDLKSSR